MANVQASCLLSLRDVLSRPTPTPSDSVNLDAVEQSRRPGAGPEVEYLEEEGRGRVKGEKWEREGGREGGRKASQTGTAIPTEPAALGRINTRSYNG